MGFCVEDWNINMAVAPRAPLSRSDTKAFIRLSRLGKFLLEQCSSHLPAFIAGHASRIRGCNGLANTRCKFCHLLDHKAGQMPRGKSDFLWNCLFFLCWILCRMVWKSKVFSLNASQIAYIHVRRWISITTMWHIFLTIAWDMVNANGKLQKNSETLLKISVHTFSGVGFFLF